MCLGSEDDIENRRRRKRPAATKAQHRQDEASSIEADLLESWSFDEQPDPAGPTSRILPDL